MAEIGPIVVPLNFSMTSTSKAMVKRLIAEVAREADMTFPSEENMREFVRSELHTILVGEFDALLAEYREKREKPEFINHAPTRTASTQLKLGQIIEGLEAIESKDQKHVFFDFSHAFPTSLASWRGVYAELALGFSFDGNAPTVDKQLNALKDAIGAHFEGYKGGMFRMSKDTPVWVANYGYADPTAIVGMLESSSIVILETRYMND